MQKVRGKVFTAFFQEFRWGREDEFIVALISSAN